MNEDKQRSERIRRSMQEETDRLRRRLSDMQEEKKNSSATLKRSIIIICIIGGLVAVAAVAVWWYTQSSSEIVLPVGTNTSTPHPITLAPTQDNMYDRPSSEDCLAIGNGSDVGNQETMILKNFVLSMDVLLANHEMHLDELMLLELEEKIQLLLMPDLAGCFDPSSSSSKDNQFLQPAQAQNLSSSSISTTANENNYVIGNALVLTQYLGDDHQCRIVVAEKPCFRVSANLDLYLKGDEKILILNALITQVFGGSEPLVDRLGLQGGTFKRIEITNLISNNPTDPSPTNMPSSLQMPIQKTSNPTTLIPSSVPSVRITFEPTDLESTNGDVLLPTSPPSACVDPSYYFYHGLFSKVDGHSNGRYEIDCNGELTDIIVLKEQSNPCEVQCLGSMYRSEYHLACKMRAGGGGGGGINDHYVDFILLGDYRNQRILIGYARSSIVMNLSCPNNRLLLRNNF